MKTNDFTLKPADAGVTIASTTEDPFNRNAPAGGVAVATGSMLGVAVDPKCVELYDQMKMKHTVRYVVYKVEGQERIVVEHEGDKSKTFTQMVALLPPGECRFAVVDFPFTSADGRPQEKLCFILWNPDNAPVKQKMLYASSKQNLRAMLKGVAKDVQATELSDLETAEMEKLLLRA
jgi:cofilin